MCREEFNVFVSTKVQKYIFTLIWKEHEEDMFHYFLEIVLVYFFLRSKLEEDFLLLSLIAVLNHEYFKNE